VPTAFSALMLDIDSDELTPMMVVIMMMMLMVMTDDDDNQ